MPLRRSALYVPGDKPRALEKARGLAADVLILDLEDAVAPDRKAVARDLVRAFLREGCPQEVAVRVNAAATPWGDDDRQMVLTAGANALVLPKAETETEVRETSAGLPVWLTIETPRGVLNAERLAAVRGVQALVAGTSDLTRDLRARHTPDRAPLLFALSRIVTVARAFGLAALDGVHLDLRDAAGLEAACRQGRDLGFDGKTLIHPDQIDAANRLFGPSPEEVERARRLVAAWEAREAGVGVIVFEGQMVEALHVSEARDTIAASPESPL